METLGSLVDKLSIAQIRYSKTSNPEVLTQCNNLVCEIDSYLYTALKGEIPLEEPKYKSYFGESKSELGSSQIGLTISKLMETNLRLWDLEDKRRDKNISDTERLAACDEVAVKNRLRNDCMDKINHMLKELLNVERY